MHEALLLRCVVITCIRRQEEGKGGVVILPDASNAVEDLEGKKYTAAAGEAASYHYTFLHVC